MNVTRTDKQTNRLIDRQTDIDGQIDRRTDGHRDRAGAGTERRRHRHRHWTLGRG